MEDAYIYIEEDNYILNFDDGTTILEVEDSTTLEIIEDSIQIIEMGIQGPQGPIGLTGATGAQGPQGAVGVGVVAGGTTGQLLAKTSNTNYATGWVNAPVTNPGGSNKQIQYNNSGVFGGTDMEYNNTKTSYKFAAASAVNGTNSIAGGIAAVGNGPVDNFTQQALTITSVGVNTITVSGDQTSSLGLGEIVKVVMGGVAITYSVISSSVFSSGATTITLYDSINSYFYGAVNCVISKYDGTVTYRDYATAFQGGIASGNYSFAQGRLNSLGGNANAWGDNSFAFGVSTSANPFSYVFNSTSYIPSAFITSSTGMRFNGVNLTSYFVPGSRIYITSPNTPPNQVLRVSSVVYTGVNTEVTFNGTITATFYGASNFNVKKIQGYYQKVGGFAVGQSTVARGDYSFSFGQNVEAQYDNSYIFGTAIYKSAKAQCFDFAVTNSTYPDFHAESNKIGINTDSPAATIHSVNKSASAIGQILQAAASPTANLAEYRDSTNNVMFAIAKNGALKPASMADTAADPNTIYYSTTAGKLVYKDGSGTINNLY